ncbi:MAG: phosphotriesterase [Marinilabilia sp.]
MTVTGPISPSELGETLSHEHIMVDWIGADSTGNHRWDRDSVVDVVRPWLMEIKELGVESFVDCTPAYLGRDPLVLKRLSEETGLNILTNTGYYGAVDNKFIPEHAYSESAEELARRWIDEFENGIDDTGIKPGFIKIGVKVEGELSGLHRKLITAAGLTHKKTGLVIKSHTGGDMPAFEQINILQDMGISPAAFIWTHAQNGSLEKNLEAAKKGAWVSLDGVNISNADEDEGNKDVYIDRLKAFKDADLLNRVLLSHDAGWYDVGQPGGGEFRSYSDIHEFLGPALKATGFTNDDIKTLLIENPATAFKIQVLEE